MTVSFRNEYGVCVFVDVDVDYGITFDNGYVYFTDTYGDDYEANAKQLISITKAE